MIRYYGQFINPKVDEYLNNEFFKNKRNGFFIECGAFDGIIESSGKVFEESLGWSCINIEAHPGLFKRLKDNRPDSTNLNYALTSQDKEGILEFYGFDFINEVDIKKYGPHRGSGHLSDIPSQHKDTTPSIYKVEGITYKTLIEKFKVDKVDLFVLDVEGSELDVINGMKGCCVLPDVLCIEYVHVGLDILNKCMFDLGYKFYSKKHVNAHYIKK